MVKLLRVTTVPISLKLLLRGQLEYMMKNDFDVLAVSADGPEVKDIVAGGVSHRVIPMTRKITPLRDTWALLKMIGLIITYRPHIVHSHTPKAGLIAMIAAWFCRVPVRLHTVGGLPLLETKGVKRRLLWFVEKLTYRFAHRVYVNSSGLKTIIHQMGVSEKISLLGKGSTNGIDTTFFNTSIELHSQARALRQRLAIGDHEIVYCFVGRIVADKGINELVSAFQSISAKVPSRLLLVGPVESELDPVLPSTAESIANSKVIHSLGYLQDVRPAILAADVFVFPSYREGFPNVVMQACCLSRATIVTDINGCNEIIENRSTGLIVPPKNKEALEVAMTELAVDRDLRLRLAGSARQYVEKNFDQTYIWELVLNEYRKLLVDCTTK